MISISEVPATGWRACTRTIALDVGATIPKHLVIKRCRHSVPPLQGLIMGASPFVQPPPTHVSLPLGEGGNSHWHFWGFYELGKLLFVA